MSEIVDIAKDALARLLAANVAGGVIERGRVKPARLDSPPLVLVFCRGVAGTSAGAARVTQTELFNTATLRIEVYDTANSGSDLEDKLGVHTDAVIDALINNADFMSGFEGVAALRIDFEMPRDGDVILGSTNIEIDLHYSIEYRPTFSDDFVDMDVSRPPESGLPNTQINPEQT